MVCIESKRGYLRASLQHIYQHVRQLYAQILRTIFPDDPLLTQFLAVSPHALQTLTRTARNELCESCFPYKNPILRAAIHALKYKGDRRVARKYATPLARAVIRRVPSHAVAITIIPMPASPYRMKQYGFNQCLLLADEVVRIVRQERPHTRWGIDTTTLIRTEGTMSQTKLHKAARAAAVMHAFTTTTTFAGKDILIIDDVWTTGATAR
ncbi:MAG: hypothetical protein RL150_457, partial [Candidatus Parcubacteria bacterium]